jgi:uncharacterized membrane protein/protein-disulfide isomerase
MARIIAEKCLIPAAPYTECPVMTSRDRALILALSTFGLAFAGTAAWVHYQLLTAPGRTAFCEINQTFACTQVYLSRFGAEQGVPVAVGGVLWFALIGLIAWMTRPGASSAQAGDDPTTAYLFILATAGFSETLYLEYASFFLLREHCVLCIGTHVAVIGLFIVTGLPNMIPMRDVPGRIARDLGTLVRRPAALVLAVAFVVAAVSLIDAFPKPPARRPGLPPAAPRTPATSAPAPGRQTAQPELDRVAAFLQSWDRVRRASVSVPADGAKLVIVKFNDYLCPTCKVMYYTLKPILEKYQRTNAGAIKYVVKDFPLNSGCNAAIAQTKPGHEASCAAAVAARMARAAGKADAMEQWLWENQEKLTTASVKAAVSRVLGPTDFDGQLAALLPDIRRDAAEGAALKLTATPTFYFNGVPVVGQYPANLIDAGIEHELTKRPRG